MKIAATSDTHGRWFDIPPCDVFIHCGDLTAGGTEKETRDFAGYIDAQDQIARHSLIVPGNHDRWIYENQDLAVEMFMENDLVLLIDKEYQIDNNTFYGSPWTPPFMQWYFMAGEDKLRDIYKKIPHSVDVLITHGPPYGILDPGWNDAHVGTPSLLTAVQTRYVRHHVFGHLHADGGKTAIMKTRSVGISTQPTTLYHNVAACNDAYVLANKALEFDI
jgi:Icc-related predicted phosphoesterase